MKSIFLLFLAIFLFFAPQNVFSQCSAGFCTSSAVQFGATQSTTSNTFVNSVSCTGANQYNLFNVTAGQTYEWSMCSGDGALIGGLFDTDMSLYNHSNGALICYNDDEVTNACGLNSKIIWTANFTGSVRVQVTEYSCQQLVGACLRMAWRCATCTGSYDPCVTIPTISNCGVSSTFTQTGTTGSFDITAVAIILPVGR
jgi:hypothetical protein